jgi:hypothetical protein
MLVNVIKGVFGMAERLLGSTYNISTLSFFLCADTRSCCYLVNSLDLPLQSGPIATLE